MVQIFYLVFSQLAVGGFALLLLVPKGLIGRGFYRLMGGIYLVAVGCARGANLVINGVSFNLGNFLAATQGRDVLFTLVFGYLVLLYLIALWLKPDTVHRILLLLGTIVGFIWIVSSAQPYLEKVQLPAKHILLPTQFVVSSLLLGAVNTGMWFGHWYLVTPNLPVVHLKRFNHVYLGALLAAIVFVGGSTLFWRQADATNPFTVFHELIFWLRILLGLGGSAVMYLIIWYCLRDKATQRDAVGATRAATGFLYIAMITVFTGELCGRLLLLETRLVL